MCHINLEKFGKCWNSCTTFTNVASVSLTLVVGGGGGLYCENDHKNVKVLETINWFVEWTLQFQIWRYKIIWYLVRINRCRIQQLIYGSQPYLRSENFIHNDGSFNLDYSKWWKYHWFYSWDVWQRTKTIQDHYRLSIFIAFTKEPRRYKIIKDYPFS